MWLSLSQLMRNLTLRITHGACRAFLEVQPAEMASSQANSRWERLLPTCWTMKASQEYQRRAWSSSSIKTYRLNCFQLTTHWTETICKQSQNSFHFKTSSPKILREQKNSNLRNLTAVPWFLKPRPKPLGPSLSYLWRHKSLRISKASSQKWGLSRTSYAAKDQSRITLRTYFQLTKFTRLQSWILEFWISTVIHAIFWSNVTKATIILCLLTTD